MSVVEESAALHAQTEVHSSGNFLFWNEQWTVFAEPVATSSGVVFPLQARNISELGFNWGSWQKPVWVTQVGPFWMYLWKHRDTHANQTSQTFQSQVDTVEIQCVPCLHFKHWSCVSHTLLQRMKPTGKQDTNRAVLLHYSMLALGLLRVSLPLTFNKVLSLSVGNPIWGKGGLVWYMLCTMYMRERKESQFLLHLRVPTLASLIFFLPLSPL